MGRLDHLGRRLYLWRARPMAKRCAQNRLLFLVIGSIGGFAEVEDALAIGQHHGRINPVKRGA